MKIRVLFFLALLFSISQAFAQSRITGKLLDAQTGEPLIGATVLVKGTTIAASASLDGTFKLTIPAPGTGVLIFSYIGYTSKEMAVTGNKSLGEVKLESSANSLNEVVINSTVIDRKTPIAVSTVNAQFIEEKGAGQEFPELLKGTPGVMATRTGGGYGDSRISIRGFSDKNVAFLINGIPVNDVETGRIFWSDWAGLADVTTSMQVQRGLGASKVAAPSLGGTIGITTRSTDGAAGGYITQSIGSYGDRKTAVSISSGLTDKGWASSFMLAKREGDGNAVGLYYHGISYFFNLSKVLSKTQNLSFNILGASQTHAQRFTNTLTIAQYKNAPDGIRFNSDYGILNGQITSPEVNFYNKPLAALNHSWTINESTQLSTVAYASYGTGAASFSSTGIFALPRTGEALYSPVDFNAVVKTNLANSDGVSSTYLQNAANDHKQYGVLSTLKKRIGDNVDVLAGVDLRYYQGSHYYEMANLLGGQYVLRSDDVNNPNYHVKVGDRFNRNYDVYIPSEGLFLQTEYSKNNLSAFISLSASNTGNKRIDYFSYLTSNPNRETQYLNFLGYQAKGGANYNLDKYNSIYANIGTLQRPPLVASLFLNNNNTINPNAVPEKLFSYELGYAFRSALLTANINVYRSTYKNRSVAPKTTVDPNTGSITTANLSGLNELHQGVEIDAKFRPIKDVTISGMLSVADWHYLTNAGPAQTTSDDPTVLPVTISQLFIKNLKVGDAAQTTAALGIDVNILPKLKIGSDFNYYANYTPFFDPTKIASPTFSDTKPYVPYKLPNYGLFDVNAVFRFKIAGLDGSFIGNINNLFNTVYLSDAYDSTGLANTTNTIGVYYGIGRTFTTTLKIQF